VIVGASFDTPEDNKLFADEQGFPFRLLGDVDRSVGDAYGIKRGDDEPYPDFPKRVTFLIDPDGVIRRVYEVKDVHAHPGEVLEDLIALRG
jgi:peroxiredoxin Q/BCP